MPVQTIDYTILRNSFLFVDVNDERLKEIARYLKPTLLEAGETLFEQDDDSDAMYFMESGQVHVIRHYPDGDEVILATEVPYYVIGELSMLANEPRTGSVVAVGDCDLLKLSREDFIDIFTKMPEVAVNALDDMGKRLYKLNLRVRENAIGNVGARLASVLIMLEENQKIQAISITRMARATAMDADVVERLLRQWERKGIISLDDKKITIKDKIAIQILAG